MFKIVSILLMFTGLGYALQAVENPVKSYCVSKEVMNMNSFEDAYHVCANNLMYLRAVESISKHPTSPLVPVYADPDKKIQATCECDGPNIKDFD